MTINEKRARLKKEIVVAEELLKCNVESYSLGDFIPSLDKLYEITPTIIQEHPKDIIKIASLVSKQVWSDEHLINRILTYIKQGLFLASLWKKS